MMGMARGGGGGRGLASLVQQAQAQRGGRPSTAMPPQMSTGLQDPRQMAKPGFDPRSMPPQTRPPMATTQPVGAPNVQNLPRPQMGKPQMDPRSMPPQGGNPMQRQLIQAQQMRGGMRRPPNPTGNRRPMRGGGARGGGGRRSMY